MTLYVHAINFDTICTSSVHAIHLYMQCIDYTYMNTFQTPIFKFVGDGTYVYVLIHIEFVGNGTYVCVLIHIVCI